MVSCFAFGSHVVFCGLRVKRIEMGGGERDRGR